MKITEESLDKDLQTYWKGQNDACNIFQLLLVKDKLDQDLDSYFKESK